MSARRKVVFYGLSSQKKIPQNLAERILKEKGFVLNDKNANCLFMHNKKESLKHLLVKAILLKILVERNRTAGCEIEVGNGIADVFDSENKIVYEIESGLSKRRIKEKTSKLSAATDIIFIDTKKIPNNMFLARKCLQKIIV